MKRLFIAFFCLCACMEVSAQSEPTALVADTEVREVLPSFSEIDIFGRMDVQIIQCAASEPSKIEYDLHGESMTIFSVKSEKGRISIHEKLNSKRESVTSVKIYCHDIKSLDVEYAKVTFVEPVKSDIIDITLRSMASLSGEVDALDMRADVGAKSFVSLTGSVRYLDLDIVGAGFNSDALEVMSADVDASHNSEVTLSVGERLNAKVSTKATITYGGEPTIVRTSNKSLLSGEVKPLE